MYLRTRAILCLVLTAVLLGIVGIAPCATFTVTRIDDPTVDGCDVNGCSLREAILAANLNSGADVVIVPAGYYTLEIAGTDEDNCATGDLDIVESIEIQGAGAATTIIDANAIDRVFEVVLSASSAAFSGLTIRGGYIDGSNGGGIRNLGNNATVTVTGCAIVDNYASSGGGGVFQPVARTFQGFDSTFSGNQGPGAVGDEIWSNQGTLELTNCTVSSSATGVVSVFNNSGTMTILNSTLVHTAGTVVRTDSDPATLTNTVVVGSCYAGSTGSFVSGGGNLESPGDTCGLDQPSDQVAVPDADLRDLGMHGGTTATHAPRSTSPVVDTALDGPCPAADQRGLPRPMDGDGDQTATCDCGSVEFEPPMFGDGFESGDGSAWSDVVP
jgi:CSLREA domain-containing protein